MPAIVGFPTLVKQALEESGSHFANEPERQHFAEYLTGLMIANHKNVSAINREFAVTTDQSCLNRWIAEAEWDEEEINQKRLKWLQKRQGGTGQYLQEFDCRTIGQENFPVGRLRF